MARAFRPHVAKEGKEDAKATRSIGTWAFGRVSEHWCSEGTMEASFNGSPSVFRSLSDSSLSTLVCSFKKRRYLSKAQTNNGLSPHKCSFGFPPLQNGVLESNFSFCEKGNVCLQNRSSTCLFPFAFGKKFTRLFGTSGGGQILPVSGSTIWPKSFAFPVVPHFLKELTAQLVVLLEELLHLTWVTALEHQHIHVCLKTEGVQQALRPGFNRPVQVFLVVEAVVVFWGLRCT